MKDLSNAAMIAAVRAMVQDMAALALLMDAAAKEEVPVSILDNFQPSPFDKSLSLVLG
jgi:hypothetical protein